MACKPRLQKHRAFVASGYTSPGDSPFLKKLPREVRSGSLFNPASLNANITQIRDKIYSELLIVQRSREDQITTDKLHRGRAVGDYEYQYERQLDILQHQYILIPDRAAPNQGMEFIGKGKSILLVNRQIYAEATAILFGKNVFGLLPDIERAEAPWRCDTRCLTVPKHLPCQLR